MLSMRWQDIDWTTETWRIPQTKNREPLVVPLSKEALSILKERYGRQKGGKVASIYVFPGKGKTGHLVEPKKAWERILQRAGHNRHPPPQLKNGWQGSLQSVQGM